MAAPKLARMAWRNLWRNRRRTILTLISIAFGGFVAVIMTAMQDQSFTDFIDTAARMGSGHVTVQHPEYLDTPSLNRTVRFTESIRRAAEEDPDVAQVRARITGQAMLSTARDNFGVLFIAFDPAVEDETTLAFIEGLGTGPLFASSKDKGIILGKTLARNLNVEPGKKVVYTLTDRTGQIVSGLARVSRIIETGTPSMDARLCLLPIDSVRQVLGYAPDEATQIAAFLNDSRRSAAVAERLRAQLGEGPVALTWEEAKPELAAFIAMKVGGGRFMEIVIALLVAAGIFNTLFVSVMERLREFGIMLAVGTTPGHLFRLVMWESLWLALVGIVLGAALTIGPYLYLASTGIDISAMTGGATTEVGGVGFPSVMRVGIFPEHLALILVLIVLATMAAGLYPAWKAGRIRPVETIRLV